MIDTIFGFKSLFALKFVYLKAWKERPRGRRTRFNGKKWQQTEGRSTVDAHKESPNDEIQNKWNFS